MDINAGDYVMLKSVDEVKHLYDSWKVFFSQYEVFVDTGDRHFSSTMLKAMDACDVYRVAWSDDDRVCVFIDKDAYVFDKKCIESVYRLVKVN